MALDDLLISTGVDQLIRLVKERGRVELSAAAKELKLPLRTAEDWAHVLEEEGIILIEYRLTKIQLVWKAPTSEQVEKKAEKLEAKAQATKGDVERLLAKVQKGGEELSGMQEELARLEKVEPITLAEAKKMRAELAELDKAYAASVRTASEKLTRLKKKLSEAGDAINGAEQGEGSDADLEKEIAMLRNFENTLKSQLDDSETFYEAFETRLEDFRKRLQGEREDERIAQLVGELGQLRGAKAELDSAMAALSDEHKGIGGRIAAIEKKISELSGGEDSVSGAKKKLAELKKIGQDASRQKSAVARQLNEAIALVKTHAESLMAAEKKNAEARNAALLLKDEYVDISEEVSRANEELAARQKKISATLSQQMAALNASSSGKVSKEELQKVSFLLRELKREEALLEEKVKLLHKESEIFKLESEPSAPKGRPPRAEEERKAVAFVEKVRLSQEEEGEFERKREELRSLIRKMWEENKGGASPG